jgi:hypothetical protein
LKGNHDIIVAAAGALDADKAKPLAPALLKLRQPLLELPDPHFDC